MVARTLWALSLSLVLAGGCGKKDPEPTNNPDASAAATDPGDTTASEEPTDRAEPSDDPGTEADVGDAAPSHQALLKLKLKRGGKTIEHPGYMVVRGEEITILMTQGSHTHEVDFLYDVGDSGFDVKVSYRDNGRDVLSKETTLDKQQWIELKSGDGKTVLSVFLDPDAGRIDEVETVEGDDPLGGV